MHATSTFYLNDATEYTYATDKMCIVLDSYLKDIDGDAKPSEREMDDPRIAIKNEKYSFIKQVKDYISTLKDFAQIYILSFSAVKDDLSQWRGSARMETDSV